MFHYFPGTVLERGEQQVVLVLDLLLEVSQIVPFSSQTLASRLIASSLKRDVFFYATLRI